MFRLSYRLEEARQRAEAHRWYIREALASVALALLRIVGQA